MIRPLTLLSMVAAAGAGLYLYQVKHSVAQLDRELRNINRQTEQARERTQVLRAEWALLNEPERLRQVAQRHLPLEPMAPAQFVRTTELERRLPAARTFAAPASLFAPTEPPGDGRAAPLAIATAEPRNRPPVAAPAAPVAPTAAEPAAPEPAAAVVVAAMAPAAAAAPPGLTAPAAAAAAVAAVQATRPAAARTPEQQGPRLASAAAARPTPAPAAPRPPVQRALHVEQPAQANPVQRVAAPPITSVLATGGPALAPPVPIARASAATLSGGTGR